MAITSSGRYERSVTVKNKQFSHILKNKNTRSSLLQSSVIHESAMCDNQYLKQLEIELKEYFEGKRQKFTVPLAPVGTPFQAGVRGTPKKLRC